MADIAADDGAAEETILTSHKRTIPMMATELAVGEEDRWASWKRHNNHTS